MAEAFRNVKLLRHTLDPEEMVAMAALLCYSPASIEDLEQKVSSKSWLLRESK